MPITATTLQAVMGCSREIAVAWAPHIEAACVAFRIDTPARLAAFLAQVGHESRGLSRVTENLKSYTAVRLCEVWPRRYTMDLAALHAHKPELIANYVYAGRNGNTQPGDGYLFHGRGAVMLTGRGNYEEATRLVRAKKYDTPSFVQSPDKAAEPMWAAWIAAAYWANRGLNELADSGRFDAITRRINGGATGTADRRLRHERARRLIT